MGTETGKKKSAGHIVLTIFKNLCKTGLIAAIIAVCIGAGLLLGVVAGCIITTDKLQDEDLYITGFVSFVYDKDDNIIGTLKGSENKNRVWVDYEDIPENLRNAMIAIEDERFYEHSGIDYKRSIAAFLGYFLPGFKSHGGSTITQQVVKNITGDDARSVPRKIREQWRALQLEKDHSKEEIIELYCNVIYMANNVYGVKTAASGYFNKDLSELTLGECAYLAGITNSPSKYNPMTTKGRENGYKRQVLILDKMLSLGMISNAEYKEAIQTPLKFNDDYKSSSSGASVAVNSYFMDAAVKDLRKDLMGAKGLTETQANNVIYNSGISIKTTMDSNIQTAVNEVFTDVNNFPSNKGKGAGEKLVQASITVTDPYTGYIVAMYGGYGEKKTAFAFNRATDSQRQPGSAIKPILVYGPMLDMGLITPNMVINEVPVYLNPDDPGTPWPNNSDKSYHGPSTVTQAVKFSYNVVAAMLYDQFSSYRKDFLNYLKLSGIDRTNEKQISACLGGFTNGMCTREMVGAFSPFATDGTYNPPITYTTVYDKDGNIYFENPAVSTKVYKTDTAVVMTNILREVVSGGTAAGYVNVKNGKGQAILSAGKTGTTSNKYDVWFCGFTPYYAASVWYGFDNNSTIPHNEDHQAAVLWSRVMNKIHTNLAPMDFPHTNNSQTVITPEPGATLDPNAKIELVICSESGMISTPYCPHTEKQSFPIGSQPTVVCPIHSSAATATPEVSPDPDATPDSSSSPEPSTTPSSSTPTPAPATEAPADPTNPPSPPTEPPAPPTEPPAPQLED